jgi:segregation and condensation protein B
MERERLKSVIESLLLVAEAPLTLKRLVDALEGLEGVERQGIIDSIAELQAEYERGARGFRIAEVAHGYQLRTPAENADWVRRIVQGKQARLTRPSLETLAIIAYRQPVTKAEVEGIRGVGIDGVLTTLLERRLVRIVGRKDVAGRPFLYGTTGEFLTTFNLKDLSQLPTLKEMEEVTAAVAETGGEEPAGGAEE